MTLTVPATPLLCMRTEAGQLFYLQFGQMYVILFLTVPAAPIPCALESARHADQSGSFFNKIVWYNDYVQLCESIWGSPLGLRVQGAGASRFEGSLLINLWYNSVNSLL
jgi:hypothetical protein